MMNGLFRLVVAVAILGNSGFAETPNVFVTLYQERINMAKAEVKKQEAETQYQHLEFERARYLLAQKAIAKAEYDRIEANYKGSLAEKDVRRAQVVEAEAMLEVIKNLLEHGQPVPLCRP